jgi:hypothetical protein
LRISFDTKVQRRIPHRSAQAELQTSNGKVTKSGFMCLFRRLIKNAFFTNVFFSQKQTNLNLTGLSKTSCIQAFTPSNYIVFHTTGSKICLNRIIFHEVIKILSYLCSVNQKSILQNEISLLLHMATCNRPCSTR